jgi:hypothetical protein
MGKCLISVNLERSQDAGSVDFRNEILQIHFPANSTRPKLRTGEIDSNGTSTDRPQHPKPSNSARSGKKTREPRKPTSGTGGLNVVAPAG